MHNIWVTKTMTVSEVRAALPRILESVNAGDEVTITHHGKPVAVIVHPDTLRARRATSALDAAAVISGVIDRGRATDLGSSPLLTRKQAAVIAAEVRASRSHGRSE
jgi:prevent-host-death family protein